MVKVKLYSVAIASTCIASATLQFLSKENLVESSPYTPFLAIQQIGNQRLSRMKGRHFFRVSK